MKRTHFKAGLDVTNRGYYNYLVSQPATKEIETVTYCLPYHWFFILRYPSKSITSPSNIQ